ncbi:MAG: hypothetical protein ACSHXF_04690 [Aquaticitalea sp.]
MKKIVLHPLKGIQFENKEILEFGTSKTDLIQRFGKASSGTDKQLFYDDLELRIDFDNSDKIEFIEFIYGPFPEKTEIELYGINPFKSKSADLIELLTENNNGEIDSSEEPYCFAFLETSVGIFRDSCESDVEVLITELKKNGAYSENENWVLEDEEKAKYFWTIGLGKKDYYR